MSQTALLAADESRRDRYAVIPRRDAMVESVAFGEVRTLRRGNGWDGWDLLKVLVARGALGGVGR